MKKVTLLAITVIGLAMPLLVFGQMPGRNLTYRVFVSQGVSSSNDILTHLNASTRLFCSELSRDRMDAFKNEQEFVQWMNDNGLSNTKAELRLREWEEAKYIVYLNQYERKGNCQIMVRDLENGTDYRGQAFSKYPYHVAKTVALMMAEQVSDSKYKRAMKRAINSYFRDFRNFRTIDMQYNYNGAVFPSEEQQTIPISGGIGLTLPLTGPLCFSTRFSGTYYDKDKMDISGGIGLLVQKNNIISPEIALFGGYAEKIQDNTHNGGPFLEPQIGLGFYLGENLKVTATASFQLSYSLSSQEFYTSTFAGAKVSLGF